MSEKTDADMGGLAKAAAKWGDVIELSPTLCCGIVWSSDPGILDEMGEADETGAVPRPTGWTRDGRCAKCERRLVAQA